jgi:hypothetical protein
MYVVEGVRTSGVGAGRLERNDVRSAGRVAFGDSSAARKGSRQQRHLLTRGRGKAPAQHYSPTTKASSCRAWKHPSKHDLLQTSWTRASAHRLHANHSAGSLPFATRGSTHRGTGRNSLIRDPGIISEGRGLQITVTRAGCDRSLPQSPTCSKRGALSWLDGLCDDLKDRI